MRLLCTLVCALILHLTPAFLASSLGNFIGGRIAGLFETFPLPQLFGAVCLTTGASAVILFFLIKPIRNLMGGVH